MVQSAIDCRRRCVIVLLLLQTTETDSVEVINFQYLRSIGSLLVLGTCKCRQVVKEKEEEDGGAKGGGILIK